MKKISQIILTLFILFLCSCSKDDTPNQVGSWDGVQFQTITTDGTQTSESSFNIGLTLMESGSGNLTGLLALDGRIHWVVDEVENKIYIISDITLSNGNEATTTDKFDLIVDTAEEQTWEQTDSFQNPAGEAIEIFTRWSLLKN